MDKAWLKQLKEKQKVVFISAPFFPIKARVLEEVYSLKTKRFQVYSCDFRELPSINLSNIYQFLLFSLGIQTKETNKIFLFFQLKKELKKKNKRKIVFVLFNLQIIYPVAEVFFTNLESLAEEVKNLFFVFHFSQNIQTERTKKQFLTCSLLPEPEKMLFIPLSLGWQPKNASAFFYSLNENEQVVLRQVFSQRSILGKKNCCELNYLVKTGILDKKGKRYFIKIKALEKFFLNEKTPFFGKFKLIKKQIFYNNEKLNSRLSGNQNKLLLFLIKNKGTLISRDKLAEALWGKAWYEKTSWALDKNINRLQKRLKILCGNSYIKVFKKRGVVFEGQLLKEKSFNKKTKIKKQKASELVFKKIKYNQEVFRFYLKRFSNSKARLHLFDLTPKSKDEIKKWLTNLISNKTFKYYLIFRKSKIIGHIGLKNINYKFKSADLGSFLFPYALWPRFGKSVFRFIIKKAKSLNLQTLTHNPAERNKKERQVLEKIGFKKLVGSKLKFRIKI